MKVYKLSARNLYKSLHRVTFGFKENALLSNKYHNFEIPLNQDFIFQYTIKNEIILEPKS